MIGLRRAPRPPRRCGCCPVAAGSAALTLFLVGLRVGLNMIDGNVIDVGYSGVIGADKLAHGRALYGGVPDRQRRRATPTARCSTSPTCRSS